ncbi:hypothetical protein B0H14DRAFT_3855533 [Mycena olivaceomarginata]|nr:hypothetical protein B0H14DRAFT_3855533 [Mycena olivaceomarginata]
MSSIPPHWLLHTPPPSRPSGNSVQDFDDDGLTSLSGPPQSSSPITEQSLPLPMLSLKRPGEDLGTEAFSQLTGPEQSVWIAAHLLESNHRISTLVPIEAVYRIPAVLTGRIDMTCFLALVDHKAFSYVHKSAVHGPIARVVNYLGKHPSWGLTSDLKADRSKFKVIKGRVGSQLTHYRNVIKSAIGDSIGHPRDPTEPIPRGEPTCKDAQDILVLCQRILSLGGKVAPDIKLSMEMASRMAYVRHIYQTKLDKNTKNKDEEETEADKVPGFWTAVDKGLEEIREETHGVEEVMSRLFSRSLADDLALYGKVVLDHLAVVPPHTLE